VQDSSGYRHFTAALVSWKRSSLPPLYSVLVSYYGGIYRRNSIVLTTYSANQLQTVGEFGHERSPPPLVLETRPVLVTTWSTCRVVFAVFPSKVNCLCEHKIDDHSVNTIRISRMRSDPLIGQLGRSVTWQSTAKLLATITITTSIYYNIISNFLLGWSLHRQKD